MTQNQLTEQLDFSWSDDSIRFINTPSVTAKATYFYVQEAGRFLAHFPYSTMRKNLASLLMIYTEKGHGILELGGQTYRLAPHTVLFLNCKDEHHYYCEDDEDWEFLWCHFYGSSALGYYNEFAKSSSPVFEPADASFYEATLSDILKRTMNLDSTSELVVSGLLATLLTRILLDLGNNPSATHSLPEYITRCVSYIEGHFAEPITLDMLSHRLGVSKYYLSREFKKYIGVTLHEYLTITRLGYAKEQLKYSSFSVEEIALQSGYNYASHFIQIFEEHEKTTPLQYRLMWKE